MVIAKEQLRLCPFGIEARHCQYQETRSKDLLSAVRSELVFICLLDKKENCPRMDGMFKEVFNE